LIRSLTRQSLLHDRILAPQCNVGFEKLFLRDTQLEGDRASHLRNNAVPRCDAIADCARLLIDAFDDRQARDARYLQVCGAANGELAITFVALGNPRRPNFDGCSG